VIWAFDTLLFLQKRPTTFWGSKIFSKSFRFVILKPFWYANFDLSNHSEAEGLNMGNHMSTPLRLSNSSEAERPNNMSTPSGFHVPVPPSSSDRLSALCPYCKQSNTVWELYLMKYFCPTKGCKMENGVITFLISRSLPIEYHTEWEKPLGIF
jgi:hypothetical protein